MTEHADNKALQKVGRRIKAIQSTGARLDGLYVNEELWGNMPAHIRQYGGCLIGGVRVGKAEVHAPKA